MTPLRFALALMCSMFCLSGSVAISLAEEQDSPGLAPYTPKRIEWLALTTNSIAQHQPSVEDPYTLNIVELDHETLLILVRHSPEVNGASMNLGIDAARKVIMKTAKSYGWDKWVKIQERVETYQAVQR